MSSDFLSLLWEFVHIALCESRRVTVIKKKKILKSQVNKCIKSRHAKKKMTSENEGGGANKEDYQQKGVFAFGTWPGQVNAASRKKHVAIQRVVRYSCCFSWHLTMAPPSLQWAVVNLSIMSGKYASLNGIGWAKCAMKWDKFWYFKFIFCLYQYQRYQIQIPTPPNIFPPSTFPNKTHQQISTTKQKRKLQRFQVMYS